jgi:hypothetical protein
MSRHFKDMNDMIVPGCWLRCQIELSNFLLLLFLRNIIFEHSNNRLNYQEHNYYIIRVVAVGCWLYSERVITSLVVC